MSQMVSPRNNIIHERHDFAKENVQSNRDHQRPGDKEKPGRKPQSVVEMTGVPTRSKRAHHDIADQFHEIDYDEPVEGVKQPFILFHPRPLQQDKAQGDNYRMDE